MSNLSLNQNVVEVVKNAQYTLLVASLACIKDIPSKDKLDDSADKAFYVRMSRNIHNACEALDGKSYRDMPMIEKQSATYKKAIAEARKMTTIKAPVDSQKPSES